MPKRRRQREEKKDTLENIVTIFDGMSFHIPADPMREELGQTIVANGGVFLRKYTPNDENSYVLLSEEKVKSFTDSQKKQFPKDRTLDMKYLGACVEKEEALPVEEFLVLTKKETKTPEKSSKNTRRPYTLEEEKAMVKYYREHTGPRKRENKSLWEGAIAKGLFDRTAESLRGHFRHFLRGRLSDFDGAVDEVSPRKLRSETQKKGEEESEDESSKEEKSEEEKSEDELSEGESSEDDLSNMVVDVKDDESSESGDEMLVVEGQPLTQQDRTTQIREVVDALSMETGYSLPVCYHALYVTSGDAQLAGRYLAGDMDVLPWTQEEDQAIWGGRHNVLLEVRSHSEVRQREEFLTL